ncbi:uncharacterized protein LOC110849260 isoform X2 [Folsomia candida]|uniref:uncharacterized protein LOC110849260 isoform X2 n=1 Tax=Folsomia candida TaxID=158441 RepID=UPI000B8FD7EA|nr:uncharacterized protein LOC110849260 isoform X2 [Folsomia candida]
MMEGGGYSSDEDFVVTRPPVFAKREEEEQIAGPSAKKRAKKEKTKPTLPPASKLLVVEKKKHPLALLGKLNPPATKDEDKRKVNTETSSVRDDQAFEPPTWYYFPKEETQILEKRYPRDGRGVIFRGVDLAEEFKVRYIGSCFWDGKKNQDEGVELIRKTILDLVGTNSLFSPHNIYEDSPELILTQEEGLSDEQREQLFTAIFAKGGRVPIIDKPGWSLVIHKAPKSGIVHLCVEKPEMAKGEPVYRANRLCTEKVSSD